MQFGSDYLKPMNPNVLRAITRSVGRKIKAIQKKTPFDALAFTGMSGASVAFPLSYVTGIPLLMVRKARYIAPSDYKEKKGQKGKYQCADISHGRLVESSAVDIKRYLIVDDFVCTGDSIKTLIECVEQEEEGKRRYPEVKPIGVLLYDALNFSPYMISEKIRCIKGLGLPTYRVKETWNY